MSITPAIRVPIPELPIIVITFETTEPEVSLEQPIRQDETVTVKDGLVYNGMPETQRLMSYGEKVSIAERYVHTPLTVWLDWVNHENRIVIASGKDKIEWVRYKQTIRLERVTELLRNPDPDSEKWRDTIVDEVHKLRYQIIESDL